MTGPKNALAKKLAAEAAVIAEQEGVDTPSEPAADPAPQTTSFNPATLFGVYYQIISEAILGNNINRADGQQYRLKAADVARDMTFFVLQQQVGTKP